MDEDYNDRQGNTTNDNENAVADKNICWNDDVVHHCNNYDDNSNSLNVVIVDTIDTTLSSQQQRKHNIDVEETVHRNHNPALKVEKPFLKFVIATRAVRTIQDFYNIKDLCFHSFTKMDMYFVLSQYYSLLALSLLQQAEEEFRNNNYENNVNYDRLHGLVDVNAKCQMTNRKHNSHDAVQLLLSVAEYYSHLLDKQGTVYTDAEQRQQQDDEYVTNLESIVDCTKQQQQNYENDETKTNMNDCTKDNNYSHLFLSYSENDDSYYSDNDDDKDVMDIIGRDDDNCSCLQEEKAPNNDVVCNTIDSIVNNNKNNNEYSLPSTSTISRTQNNNHQEQQSYNENLQHNVSNLTDESDDINHLNDDNNIKSCQNTSTVDAAAAASPLLRPQSPYDESLLKLDIDYDFDTSATDIDFSILENDFLELQLEIQNFNNSIILDNNYNTTIGTSSITEWAITIDNTVSSTSTILVNKTQCTTSSTLVSDTVSCVTSQFIESRLQNPSPRSISADCNNNNNNITTSDISMNRLNQTHSSDNTVPYTKQCDVADIKNIHQQQKHIDSQTIGNAAVAVADTDTTAVTPTGSSTSTTNTIDQHEIFDNLEDDMEEEEWAMECKLLKDSIANDIDELDAIIQKCCFDNYSISS